MTKAMEAEMTTDDDVTAIDLIDELPGVISDRGWRMHDGGYEGNLLVGRHAAEFFYLIETAAISYENSTGWCGPYRRREDAERFGAVRYDRWSAIVEGCYDEAERQRVDRRMICAADPDAPSAVIDRLTAEISALRRRADADPRCWATLWWKCAPARPPGALGRQIRIDSFPSPHDALDAIGHHLYILLGRSADARQVREIRDGSWMITKAPADPDLIPF